MKYRPLIAACALSFVLPIAASAENLALILSNLSYRSQSDLPTGPGVDRIERAIKDANFNTVLMQNLSLTDAARRLNGMRGRVESAERLVVIVNGHVVTAHGDSFLLVPRAGTPINFTVGAVGLPLAPFLAAAADKPGANIVVVVEQSQDADIGTGIDQGFVPADIAQGVTVLTGPVRAMADLFTDGLLEPGVPMAAAIQDQPSVGAAGYIPKNAAFVPGERQIPEFDGVVLDDPEPELTPEEIMAQNEADLGLSRADRRKVQQNLAILGFNPRGIDGLFGPGSRRAIAAYQEDRDFDATGFLTAEVVGKLSAEADVRSVELEEEARRKQVEADARDTAYWRDTGQGQNEASIRTYLRRFPDGLFADIANERLGAIEEAKRPSVSRTEERIWNQASNQDTRDEYARYLEIYPEGAFVSQATARIDELNEQAQAEANREQYEAGERDVAGNSVARRLVESRLTSLGLNPGQVDGTFDEDTRRALRRFQEARGLPVTGYVNQATMVRILIGQ